MLPLVFLSAVLSAPPPLTLEQRIDRMLYATHGVSAASGDDVPVEAKALCEEKTTVSLVAPRLEPAQLDQKLEPQARRQADNAIGLLVGFCGQEGRDLVKQQIEALRLTRDARYVELQATIQLAMQEKAFRPRATDLHHRVGAMAGIERTALRSLAAAKDPALVAGSLQRLPSDPYLRFELARYLAAVTSKDPAVLDAFKTLRSKTTDPAVLRVLDAYAK